MTNQLAPDPSGVRDFLVPAGTQVTIFAESDSGLVRIVAATLNSAAQPVDDGGKATWKAVAGNNLLDLAFAGPDPHEIFRIAEDCGEGNTRILSTWKLQPGEGIPGGPARAFRIYAA
jgi:hypothetical protein